MWNIQYSLDKQRAHYEHVGMWRRSRLHLDRALMKFYVPYATIPEVECLQGSCLSVCSIGSVTSSATNVSLNVPTNVPSSFNLAWSIISSVVCVVGLTGVLACISYLARHNGRSKPSTIINYVILIGVGVLYVTTILLQIEPSDASCGMRRFFLGFSYVAICSGLLARSIHVWRRTAHPEVQLDVSSIGAGTPINY